MAILNVLIGIPGSGKTTFVKKFLETNDAVLVSTDLVRQNNKGIAEDLVWPQVYKDIGNNLKNGHNCVFDATNISLKVRNRLKENVNKYCDDYKLVGYYFPTYYKICIERVKKRNQMPNELFLPIDVISNYGEYICPPSYKENFDKVYVVSSCDKLLNGIINDGYQGYGLYYKDNNKYVEEYSGFSDIENAIAVRDNTNFRLASVTKQFIAYAICSLVDKNLLSFKTSLYDLFDNMPLYTKDITIKNMLNHTSGLLDYENMPHTDIQVLDLDVLKFVMTTNTTYFKPGSKYQYSNTAYVILGLIIEKVSNMKLDKYLKENVFDAAGLLNTYVNYQGITNIPSRAYGTSEINGKRVITDQYWCSATIGDGGIYSNIPDLKKWLTFIKGINKYPYSLMKETTIIDDTDIKYGLGLRVEKIGDKKLIYHCGSTIGTNTVIGYVEESEIEFALLLNSDNISCDKFIANLREQFND